MTKRKVLRLSVFVLAFLFCGHTICRYLRIRMGSVGDSGADALTLSTDVRFL